MTTENYGAPPPADAPKPSFGSADYWDANAKEAVFIKWRPKDSKEAEQRETQLQGNFDACWKEWDEGSPENDVKAGWRFRLRLKDREGKAIVIRMGATVYIYSLIAKLHMVAQGSWIAINIRNGGEKKTVCFPDVSVWNGAPPWELIRGIELDKAGDRFAEALALIEQHSAYIQPPKKADPNNMVGSACAEAEAKGWPSIGQETEQLYLELIAEVADGELFDGLSEVPDAVWGQFRQWMKDTEKQPVKIQAFMKRMARASTASVAAQSPVTPTAAPPEDTRTPGEKAMKELGEGKPVTPEYDPYADKD